MTEHERTIDMIRDCFHHQHPEDFKLGKRVEEPRIPLNLLFGPDHGRYGRGRIYQEPRMGNGGEV